jgi:hypothetical protein
MREENMKDKSKNINDEMRPEYDFDYSKAVWGKYNDRLHKEGSNIVVLDADVAKSFRDSAAVNKALRTLLSTTHSTKRLTKTVNEHTLRVSEKSKRSSHAQVYRTGEKEHGSVRIRGEKTDKTDEKYV